MYAIASDLIISEPKKRYKDPYNNIYAEVKKVLEENGFYRIQGSTYVTEGDLGTFFRAIQSSKKFSWFCLSVRDVRAFRIEDYFGFTGELKENTNS